MLGQQFTIVLEECQKEELLDDLNNLSNGLLEIVRQCGLIVVKTTSHKFNPIGVTVIMILSQSHLAVHTWPEHQTTVVTLFMCQEGFDLRRFTDGLANLVSSQRVEVVSIFSK